MDRIFALSICLSSLVVVFSIIPLNLGRLQAGYSLDNMSAPRAIFDSLPEFGKRAVWCHQNCWESISLHAPACLLCLLTLPESNISFFAAITHPFLRLVYICAYIFNLPKLRGLAWALGLFTTAILFKEGLYKLI